MDESNNRSPMGQNNSRRVGSSKNRKMTESVPAADDSHTIVPESDILGIRQKNNTVSEDSAALKKEEMTSDKKVYINGILRIFHRVG